MAENGRNIGGSISTEAGIPSGLNRIKTNLRSSKNDRLNYLNEGSPTASGTGVFRPPVVVERKKDGERYGSKEGMDLILIFFS